MKDASPEMMSIFWGALERLTADERAAYLEAACGKDVEARARIEALLRAHEEAGGFLPETPSPRDPRGTTAPPATERPGTVIGPYKLLQQIGEGGMGVVWMAEQTQPVQRKVALKVIKPGMDSRQVIARFEAERQALAMMDHVNIARVLDVGATEAGRPYFVMELVHGVPITKYCDDNKLTPRERLELFVPVCQAIQHAHQKGIIHRDIKPSNVMITLYDGRPVPKVIDFGVAKATEQTLTERTLFTQYGTMVGTLEYMSPEQAEMSALGVDTRSDIYSLGVLLYELLTGSTPLIHKRVKEAAYAEILRMIKEEEPPRPSTRLSDSGEALATISAQRHMEPAKLTKLVRGELDWIVMKCLEKDRNRRYETANSFAADMHRYLNDETVQACPPSVAYRFRKFARRNKAALLSAVAVFLAAVVAVGGLAGGIGWAVRDRDARRATTAEQVNLALNEANVLQGQEKWLEALAAVTRAEALLANGSGDEGLQQRALQLRKELAMVAQLDELRLRKSFGGDASFKGGDSRAALGYARAFEGYGIRVLADPPREVAASIKARSIREQLLAALDDWILVQSDAGVREHLRAIAELADADKLRNRMRKAVVENDRRALEELAAGPEMASLPPATGYLLGQALANAGAGPRAVQVLATVQQRHPQEFWLNFQLGIQLLWGPGVRHNSQAAAGYLRAALVARPDYPTVYTYLGIALPGPEHLDEVIALNRKAIELSPTYSSAYNNLGIALREKKELDEAVKVFRKAIELYPTRYGFHINLGITLIQCVALAEQDATLSPQARQAAVGNYIAQTRQVFSEVSKRCRDDARHCHHLASVLANCSDARFRDVNQSIELAQRAVQLAPREGGYWLTLGLAQYRAGNWQAALEALEKAMTLRKGGDATDWFLLAMVHWQLGDKEKTRQEYDWATQWMATQSHAVWTNFRAEAAALLDLPRLVEVRSIPYTVNAPGAGTTKRDSRLLGGRLTLNVFGVAFSPDGRRVLSGGEGNDLRLHEVETGQEIRGYSGHDYPINAVAISPDGQFGLSGSHDKTVRLWNVDTGKEVRRLEGHTTAIRLVAFSPDGRLALSAGWDEGKDPVIRLWKVSAGKVIRRLAGHTGRVHSAVFSPDGHTVLSASADKTIRLWDVETGKEIRQFKDLATNTSVCFSPDGRKALSAGPDDAAPRLWDVATGKLLRRLEGSKDRSDPPHQVVFTPDGRGAVSAHHRKVRLWDVSTGKELYCVELDQLRPNHVAISADGRWVASANGRGSVSIWKLIDPRPSRTKD